MRPRARSSTHWRLLACCTLLLSSATETCSSDADARLPRQPLPDPHALPRQRRSVLGQTETDAAAIEAAAAAAAAQREAAAQRAEQERQQAEQSAAALAAAAEQAAAGITPQEVGTVSVEQAYRMLNETVGATPRLMDSLPDEGKAAMKRHRTCGAFWQRPVRRVAVVGNGPLTERQRVSANTADLVIRINKMNNRFCGERVDVWLLRHAAEDAHLRWHGLGELAHCATSEVLDQSPVLWLFGGASWWFNPYIVAAAAAKHPRIASSLTWQGIPFAPWKNLYQTYVAPLGSPSTGWIALMLALDCKPAAAALHVYGFNWSPKHWKSHAIEAEERFVRLLSDLGRVTVHETACKGLRYCGECNVVDADQLNDDASAAINAAIEANLTMPDVPCSPAQAQSSGELTKQQLQDREPERPGSDG